MKRVSAALLLWFAAVSSLHAGIPEDLQAIADSLVEQGSPAALLLVEDPVLGTNLLAAGVRDMDTMTAAQPTDRFRIASNSKTFTAAATLLLCEEGLLSLTNTVADLLPGYSIPSNNTVTVWHLLTHTSGLPDHNNDTSYFDDRIRIDPSTNFSPDEVFTVVRSLPHHFAPGSAYSYCDTGYYILHLIIDQHNTNGWRSYADFIRNRLIHPLGLTNTFVPDSGNGCLQQIPGTHIRGYLVDDDSGERIDVTEVNQSWDLGCGGMVSSTEDLAKWIKALHSGGVLTPASQAELETITTQSRQAGTPYGMATEYSPVLGFGHSGVTLGYISWMFYDPVRQTAYADMINLEDETLLFTPMGALVQAKWALGYDDIEDNRYSNTIAQVTACITNQMAQADVLINLDDPVTNHVPSFSLQPRFGSTPITVRQLLNHCSGMSGTYYNRAATLSPMPGYDTYALERLAMDYPNFPPNFVNAYNNNGFAVAEAISLLKFLMGVGRSPVMTSLQS